MTRTATEAQIQKAILEYLSARRIRYHRLNSGMMRGEHNGKSWAVKLAPKGTADILALPFLSQIEGSISTSAPDECIPMYLEVKTATGKQSAAQKRFQAEVEAEGFRYVVARSVEDVQEALA